MKGRSHVYFARRFAAGRRLHRDLVDFLRVTASVDGWMRPAAVVVLVALIFGMCGAVFAQPVPATAPVPRVVFPITPSGNTLNLGPVTANAANAANFSFGVAANGGVFANTGSRLPTPGGGAVDINVGGTIGKAAAGAAIGRFLGKALPVGYALQAGIAAYDLARELGLTASGQPGQVPTFMKDAPYVAGCGAPWPNSVKSIMTQDASGGCYGSYGGVSPIVDSTRNDGNSCYVTFHCSDGSHPGSVASWTPNGSLSSASVATEQDFLDALAAKSGWPSSSALARTVADALKSGEEAQVDPTALTGPAADAAPVVQKLVDPIANTTTTTTTTNNYTYGPSSVTMTTTNVTTNNSTGAITNNTTTTSNAPVPNVPPVPPPKPDSPPDPCTANPDRAGCAKLDVPAGEIPKSTRTITYTPDNLGFGGGQCPAPIVIDAARNWKYDYAPVCGWLSGPIKLLVLAAAALSAFFIVAGVRVE